MVDPGGSWVPKHTTHAEKFLLCIINNDYTITFVCLCMCISVLTYLPTLCCSPGSFVVRPSERTPGDYAMAFRTTDDIRHWRIVQNKDKYYVHPRPHPYETLEEIVLVL